MNKNYLYVLPLALAMVAFSGQSVAQECEGNARKPVVEINMNTGEAEPERVCAYLGSVIVFRLVSDEEVRKDTVSIGPKNPLDSWIIGRNDQSKYVVIIKVPGEHRKKKEYTKSDHGYNIIIDGKKFDPRIIVER